MAYKTQTFVDKQVLTHNDMNNIISGIDELKASGSSGNLYEEAKKIISRFQHQTVINIDPPAEKEVDIILFSGQSNSCGRAQLSDCTTDEDIILSVPMKKAFHFNNTSSTEPLKITEPISANGSGGYGYIPAFINAYYETTHRQVCACFLSVGGANLNKFVPYVLDDNSQPTTTAGSYYTNMVKRVNHAKTQLATLGYTVGGIYLVWCQGENDGYYYGYENNYTTAYEQTLTTSEAKTAYYKELFMSLVDGLKTDIGLEKAFIIRIGHRRASPTVWETYGPIVQAQSELGKEQDDCVLVSTVLAGAEKFIKEDGTVRDLMRDYTHYKPEGYVRAGLEAGTNAGMYINSGKRVKPILMEYERLLFEDDTKYERTVDAYIYDPCRVDLTFFKKLAADTVTSIVMNSASCTIGVGQTTQLAATVYPTTASNRNVNYMSDSASIATVTKDGLVTGAAIGTATITVTSEANPDVTATVSVEVVAESVDVESVAISQTSASMYVGDTLQLTVTVSPSDATNQNIVWTTGDSATAEVDQTGLVTAVEQGECLITATSAANGEIYATCNLYIEYK